MDMTPRAAIICENGFPEATLLACARAMQSADVVVALVLFDPGTPVTSTSRLAETDAEVLIVAGEAWFAGVIIDVSSAPVLHLPPTASVSVAEQVSLNALRILGLRHAECARVAGTFAQRRSERSQEAGRHLRSLLTPTDRRAVAPAPGQKSAGGEITLDAVRGPAILPKFVYSFLLRELYTTAHGIAGAYKNRDLSTEHLLAAIIDTPDCQASGKLLSMGVDLENLATRLIATFPKVRSKGVGASPFVMATTAVQALRAAKILAKRTGPILDTMDVLRGIFVTECPASDILREFGVSAADLTPVAGRSKEAGPGRPEHESTNVGGQSTKLVPAEVEAMASRLFGESTSAVVASSQHEELPQTPPVAAGEESREGSGVVPAAREPRILVCDPQNPQLSIVERAADILLSGGTVAFPTDTVYGVGADATNASAVQKLYDLKGRPSGKAIALLLHSTTQLKYIVRDVSKEAELLMEEFWPGPLTIVFPKHPRSFSAVSSDNTIGVRIPDNYLALAILSMVARPLATSSANRSGGSDTCAALEVADQIGDSVDLIVDGGEAPGKVISTVISVTEKPFRILREGAISREQIEKVLGEKVAL